ncbi:MAG: hypothetical protein ABDH49_06305 [Candidatus Hydrothermales bacterium]
MILNLILLFLFPITVFSGIIAAKLGIHRFIFHKYSAYVFFLLVTWHILRKFKVMNIYFKKRKFFLPIFYFLMVFYFFVLVFSILDFII